MIKAICFDFDGVIIESNNIKAEAFAKLFESEGQEAMRKIVDYHLLNTGVSRFDKFKFIYKEILRRPLTDDMFNFLCDKFSNLVMDDVINAPYVKGAKEFLEKYIQKYRYFLISAIPQSEIEKIVKRRGLDKFFVDICGAPIKKIDAVKKIMQREAITPKETLYIGDAMSDYYAAKNSKVNFMARVYNGDKIFDSIDCIKIKDLSGLANLVNAL